ncbi:MAG: PP2C family protein-serine/threonine phosphatase, partial [Planctomycetota bacterium]
TIEYVTHQGNPPEPLEHVLDAVRVGQKKTMLARELKRAVANDPVWSVMGEYHHWVCPFCREEQSSVDASNLFLLKRVGPKQMARHLVDDCQGFTTRREPAQIVEELGGTSMLTGKKSGGRHDYEVAARAFDSLTQSDDDVGQVTGRIMAVRPTPEEAQVHRKVQAEHEQVMQRARQVQLGSLPKNPVIPGFEIGTFYAACEDVGGDFYDFVRVSEHEWGLVMGDVSGHGIHAAMVMMNAKASIQLLGVGKSSPAETLCAVNDHLRPQLPPSIFVTVFYGVLNTRDMRLTWVRAGHNPLVLHNRRREKRLEEFEPGGMIVGMAPSAMFGKVLIEHVIDLHPGDLIFQYTDGITEAMDTEHNEYGEDRMRMQILAHCDGSLDELCVKLNEDVDAFRRGAEPNDDVTMLALRYTGEIGDGMDEAEAVPASARFNAVHETLTNAGVLAVGVAEAVPEAEPVPALPGTVATMSGRSPFGSDDDRPTSSIIEPDFDLPGGGGSDDAFMATPLSAEEMAELSGLMPAPMDFAVDSVPAMPLDDTDAPAGRGSAAPKKKP